MIEKQENMSEKKREGGSGVKSMRLVIGKDCKNQKNTTKMQNVALP